MPSFKELLEADGVKFPEGYNLKIETINESDEVKGLATAKNELQDWKLENKPLLDKLQEDSAANQKAAEDAIKEKMEAATKANNLEAYLAAEKELRETAESALTTTREGVRNATHDKVLGELSTWFNNELVGKSFAKELANTALNESGEAVTSYKLGETEYSDIAAFKEALSKDKGYGAHMKVAESKGPQFNGVNPTPKGKQPKDMTAAERIQFKNDDPEGFKKAFNLN